MLRVLLRVGAIAALVLVAPVFAKAEADPQFLSNRAAQHMSAGRVDDAIKDLDEAIRLAPDLSEAFNNRGVAYQQKRDFARALADYDQAARLEPKSHTAVMNRGNVRSMLGEYEAAIIDYELALDLKPLNPWALLNMAMARKELGQFDKALAHLDHAFKIRKDPVILRSRGSVNLRRGDPTAAVDDFSRAIRMLRSYADAYEGRGDAYTELKSYDLALADYDKALSEKPDMAGSLNGRCWVRAMTGADLEKAKVDCDRAVSLKPDKPAIILSRAYLNLRMGLREAALADAEAAYHIAPNEPHASLLRGVAQARLGRTAAAKADVARANQLDPKVATFYAGVGLAGDLSALAAP